MAEEQRCQEGHRLCANNCGFFGSPATMDLCSKCYRDLSLKEERQSSAKIAVEKSLLPPSSIKIPSADAEPSVGIPAEIPPTAEIPVAARDSNPGRCSSCRKRVGLMGFRCRCGATFCGAHRYPERHACSFDFKVAGREEIAKANPVVKADKLDGRI